MGAAASNAGATSAAMVGPMEGASAGHLAAMRPAYGAIVSTNAGLSEAAHSKNLSFHCRLWGGAGHDMLGPRCALAAPSCRTP